MKYKDFKEAIRKATKGAALFDIHESGDFQCEQTGGFPTNLCAYFEKGIAWIEPQRNLIGNDEESYRIRQLCADFGIRPCYNNADFNAICHELGEDAVFVAELPDDEDEDEGQGQNLS